MACLDSGPILATSAACKCTHTLIELKTKNNFQIDSIDISSKLTVTPAEAERERDPGRDKKPIFLRLLETPPTPLISITDDRAACSVRENMLSCFRFSSLAFIGNELKSELSAETICCCFCFCLPLERALLILIVAIDAKTNLGRKTIAQENSQLWQPLIPRKLFSFGPLEYRSFTIALLRPV